MRRSHGLVVLAAVLVAGPVVAEGIESLATLFPLRATITADGTGLCRLELPPAVISACRADLADLRILGADGREIPFIVDSPEPSGAAARVRYSSTPEILAAERSREEVSDRVTVFHERYLLGLPPPPTDVPAWDLVLEVSRREFVSRLDAVAIGPGGERSPVVTRGSIFRLPAADARITVEPLGSGGNVRQRDIIPAVGIELRRVVDDQPLARPDRSRRRQHRLPRAKTCEQRSDHRIGETHDDREQRRAAGDLGHAPAEFLLEGCDEDREDVDASPGGEEEDDGERPHQLPAVEDAGTDPLRQWIASCHSMWLIHCWASLRLFSYLWASSKALRAEA